MAAVVSQTLHFLDSEFWPNEKERELQEFEKFWEGVEYAEDGKGRIAHKDNNDVWGFFVTNLILSRDNDDKQKEQMGILLDFVSKSKNKEEQADLWNRWTDELYAELARRKLDKFLPSNLYIKEDLSEFVDDPNVVHELEPESELESEEEPEEELSEILLALYTRLVDYAVLFTRANRYIARNIGADKTLDSKKLTDMDSYDHLVKYLRNSTKTPAKETGQSKREHLQEMLTYIARTNANIFRNINDFQKKNKNVAGVDEFVKELRAVLTKK